jgi:hypothetical protein
MYVGALHEVVLPLPVHLQLLLDAPAGQVQELLPEQNT